MKIGLLLPFSKFYPYIGSDLYNCLKYVLGDSHNYVIKDTHLALPKENQNALKELILYENVDLIVGFVGYKSLTTISPLIQQTKTPIILCNAGEHPILKADVNPYIVHCSLDMFNSIYLACKWAFQNLGQNYSRLVSFFDAGFPVSFATEEAAKKYGGEIMKTVVSHKNEQDDLKSNIDLVEKEKNSFVFTAYQGFEAFEVMKYLSETKSINSIPLVSSPFFTEPEILHANVSNPIYTVKSWGSEHNDAYKLLKKYFSKELNRTPSFSGLLGYEVALIIKRIIAKNWARNEEIVPKLSDFKIESPRGNLLFNQHSNSFNLDYHLYKYEEIKSGGIKTATPVETIIPTESDWEILNNFKEELPGWQNTYLCT
ncbi:MAG: ABC transporter substrate-binding protein [Salinivirgaceae bacterium]|nr:ABC transporter substrate-binding protein [Salinivirgaceae bacterium]